MSYILAPVLATLRDHINARFPKRDKRSDGWIGDAAHSARVSDHNPTPITWNGRTQSVVCAYDFDDDLEPGYDSWRLANDIVDTMDTALKYVISHGKITNPDRSKWTNPATRWVKYTGSNGHFRHVHVSVTTRGAMLTGGWAIRFDGSKPASTTNTQKDDESMIVVVHSPGQLPAILAGNLFFAIDFNELASCQKAGVKEITLTNDHYNLLAQGVNRP